MAVGGLFAGESMFHRASNASKVCVARLVERWTAIEELAAKQSAPTLLYREPDMSVRVIRVSSGTPSVAIRAGNRRPCLLM